MGSCGTNWHFIASCPMATKFETSIWLREGPFMMRTVDSVDEAIAFLEHYRGDHGAMYHHARLMLAGAREGRISVAEARQAFSAFAEDNDLLGESAAA